MLRITGGELRGRSLEAPAGDRTRPTQAKLRQALFNSIQADLPDARVLDLFSGSGALAFEALSRGAAHAVSVESARPAAKLISKNAAALGVRERFTLIEDSVDRAWGRLAGPFDVVLADPPYAAGWELRLLQEFPWQSLLSEGGVFCLEWGTQKSRAETLPEHIAFLEKVREKTYGESVLTTYRRTTA